jgi:hypothetical protein
MKPATPCLKRTGEDKVMEAEFPIDTGATAVYALMKEPAPQCAEMGDGCS